jgi:hypothetical protein
LGSFSKGKQVYLKVPYSLQPTLACSATILLYLIGLFFFAGFCHFHPIISYSRLTLPSSDSLFPKHAPSSATIKVPKKKKMTQSYYFASNIDLNATVTSVLDTVSSKIFSAVYGYHQRGAFTPTRKNIPYLHTADDM